MKITKDKEKMHLEAQNSMQKLNNYYKWSLMHLGNLSAKNVWDAGAGIGLLAEQLKWSVNTLLLTEYSQENLTILRDKFKEQNNICVKQCDLTQTNENAFKDNKIDIIINLDVLEHLEDDQYALKLFYNVLEKKGKLLVKTPAHMLLYSNIDKASNHYRRYTKKELKLKLEKAGFKVTKIQYMNMLGAILYLWKGKILKKESNFSNTISKNSLGFINKIIPILILIEKIIPVFFGLSVVAVAEKE